MRGPALTLTVLVALAGCVATPAGPSPTPTRTATSPPPGTTSAPATSTAPEPTRTSPGRTTASSPTAPPATPTVVPVRTLPSPDRCSVGALPRPPSSVPPPSEYPPPPANVSRATVVDWTRAFATAYERNRFIATEARDAETNLTAASVYLSVTSVTRLPTGWALELGGKRSTAYASGAHGDHPLAVGYFLNETTVRREELDDRADDVGPTEGGVVLDCRA